MDVGVIGLGAMGCAMARNLVAAGHRVRAWNRSGDAGLDGVERVGTPVEALQADVVVTMLADDAAIRDVVLPPGVLARARTGSVHVVMSTISVDLARKLAHAHAAAAIGFVGAPVLGRPDVAAAGQLNVLVAGEAAAIEKAQPVFDAVGKRSWVLGSEPHQAYAAKIAANMMITMAIEAMAEALVLIDGNGVAPETFLELILGTLFAGRAYESYGAKILAGDDEPGFRMRLGLKDLDLARAAEAATGRDLPMLAAVRGQMAKAVEAGLGERDWSGIAHFTRGGKR